MKAILKREQQVIDVLGVDKENGTAKTRWIKPDGFVLIWDNVPLYELEFLKEEIDWNRRRYEIAKSAMQGILSNESIEISLNDESYEYHCLAKDIAKTSVIYADALIDELKKGEKEWENSK